MKLLQRTKIKKESSKRIGRGYGSGKGGHTVGKGTKGQRTRAGYKKFRSWMRQSNVKSLPKLRGIGKRSALRSYAKAKMTKGILNVGSLNSFSDSAVINKEVLLEKGYVKGKNISIKILGNGELTKKLTIKGIPVSKTARIKIEKAGGKVS